MGSFFSGGQKTNDETERVKEVQEQMNELRKNKVALDKPWRKADPDVFSQPSLDRLLQRINAFVIPNPCQAINLIVIGNKGSGKSSFVNTLFTALRESRQISTIAASYGINFSSTTNTLHEVTLMQFQDGKKIRIYDCRGVEVRESKSTKCYEADLKKAIDGKIKKGYEFGNGREIQEDSEFFRRNPTISERIHCVLFVANADQDQREHNNVLGTIQKHLGDNNIPLRLILTKVDLLDLCGSGKVKGIFKSRHVDIKVKLAKGKFGLQDCQILPMVNYVDGFERNITQDVLSLLTLQNILEEALAYIKNEV